MNCVSTTTNYQVFNKMKYRAIIISAIVYLLFVSCGGDVPIFTEMDTNRLKVVIKGTFETESISYFVDMSFPSSILDDSVEFHKVDDDLPENFMFDIAELRLNNKKFANYRQVIDASLEDNSPFFNFEGIVLKNDDPPEGYYDTVQIYVRKMIFDGGNIYKLGGNSFVPDGKIKVIFNEQEREGFDFNQYQQNTYVDSLKINSNEYLRSFPINIPIIGGFQYDKNEKETVLEIRLVIKNFIKKYEIPFYDSGELKLYHFYALSDWLRDVKPGDRVFGGNILAVARAYVPGKTGEVTVNAGGTNKYVIAIPVGEEIDDYCMPDRTGTPNAASGSRGFDYDLPQLPFFPGNNIEALLDYYIKYEKYKNDWNTKVDTYNDFDNYGIAWDYYDEAVNTFKIAPYVGYTGAGTTVTFSNMAQGDYEFYSADRPSYGMFFSYTGTGAGSVSPFTLIDTRTIGIGNNPPIP